MDDLVTILEDTLTYSRERDYVGWDKHDGMSSRIRHCLPFEHKLVNLSIQELIKRAPVNLRPIMLVDQRPSPKGLSLFTMANLNAYSILDNDQYRAEAQELSERVISHNVEEFDGFCLPHNHQLQGLSGKKAAGKPNVVSTSYGVKALLQAAEFDDRYATIARESIAFLESELYTEEGDTIRISYTPTDNPTSYTLNANALAARLLIDLYARFGEDRFREIADEILSYVAHCQSDIGGWEYRDPPSASHLGMDNYHNGFILESFLRFQEIVDSDSYTTLIDNGMDFYRNELYDEDGAPCWDEASVYPRDIHAAAQGIVTFTNAGDTEFARDIIDWTIQNLYADNGKFYYQKQKWYTKRFTLMRWCQAWMAYALSEYLIAVNSS